MDIRNELSNLSVWVYFWFFTLLLLWLLSFIWLWQFSLCCLLFVIPFIFFIRWWYKNRIQCTLNHVLKPFLHGFVNMTLLSFIAQFIGLLLITAIFAATHIIFTRIGYIFYLLFAITYYVTIEELLKLFFSLKARDSVQDPMQITKVHTITSTATALGYSMCTGMLWTSFTAHILNNDNKNNVQNLFGWLFLISFLIAVIGMPMHLITGYVIGCKITKRDIEYGNNNNAMDNNDDRNNSRLPFRSYSNAIYFSIFVRSAYIFFLVIGFLVIHFSIFGVFIGIVGIIFDYVVLIKHTKKVESELPFDYLQRAGQLSIFGYNVLPDHDQQNDDHANININGNGNDNDQVHITAVSLDNFALSSELINEPMVIGCNDKQNNDNKNMNISQISNVNDDADKVDIHVREDILDEDDNASSDDTHSASTIR